MMYEGNVLMLCYGKKNPNPQTKSPPSILLPQWPCSTKTNAAGMSAYLHPQEVFSALHNRSHLNSSLCQHLLQFSLQSKQKADVSQGKKKSAHVHSTSSKRFQGFKQCATKRPQIIKQKAKTSFVHRGFL